MAKTSDGTADEQQRDPVVPVVGIGASAGGLSALEALLPAIRPDSGLAYVIVQHLDPDHESVLASLLQKMSPVAVTVIKHQTATEPNHIYVIPPNASMTIEDGRLLLAPPIASRGLRTPIDNFFISLAEASGENAVGVILSGSGSDGTLGLRAIKEHGGLTIAQEGAEYDGMMRSAVRTGTVDFVLPIGDIPSKIADYFRHLDGRARQSVENGEAADYLTRITALLRTRTGHDFSGYKDKTVARRVQRRMQMLQIKQVPDFIDRLRKEPKEVDSLLHDLLIGVTNFFRDSPVFAALEEKVIARLFDNKGPDDAVRVWVPGCSTGEEAYSIAILLREHMPEGRSAPKLQVFASDIDEHALAMARIGRFPATVARDIPQKWLEKYFVREDGTYRIAPELREMCLFSAHNLLRDAPFSRLDLISCRNLLIYLTPELQNRLIPLFHYALNENGYLLLGNSENLTRHSRLFSTMDKPHRIFRRRALLERLPPEFPLTASDGARRRVPAARVAGEQEPLQSLAERQLLDRYSPAYVIIDADGDVLHFSPRTGKYLELAPGAPKTDVFSMARQGLRSVLRAGVHKTISSGQVVVQKNVLVGINGGRQPIDLIIQPLPPNAEHDPLYLVVFQDIGGIKGGQESEVSPSPDDLENADTRQLELELRTTRERLQATTELLESANEELKSGNEELSSINEELQSANEELETSKEELQSINEELQTVNSELTSRVEELSRTNSDMANLLESTQIATVFLDRNYNVKSFTPAAKDIFRLVESDTGRPISHVRARFPADTLQDDAERVLRTLATVERQIESADTGSRYIMRMVPYRTVDNVIAGVVLTFVDITRISAAEARIDELTRALRERISNLETLLDVAPVGILLLPNSQRMDEIRVNRYGADLLGDVLRGGEGEGPRLASRGMRLFQGERELGVDEHPLNVATRSGRTVSNFEGQLVRPDGERRDVIVTSTPLLDDDGEVRGAMAVIVDVSERKHAEARRQVLLYELQHRVKNILATISALATRTLRNDLPAGQFAEAFLGRLRGMAATHELLSRANWQGTALDQLIDSALRAHSAVDGNISIGGPKVTMSSNAAATLGMAFYELATNAVKYGALSVPGGRVEITWKVDGAAPDSRTVLTWRESGGKPPGPAAAAGFGTTFVRRSVEYELQGTADMQRTADGVRWTIEFPLRQNAERS